MSLQAMLVRDIGCVLGEARATVVVADRARRHQEECLAGGRFRPSNARHEGLYESRARAPLSARS